MPVVPTSCRYLTGRMLSASTAQRIVWLQLLCFFQMTMVIPVSSTAKGKHDVGFTLSVPECWPILVSDWLSNLRVHHKGCPCALSTKIHIPTRWMTFSLVERHAILAVCTQHRLAV